MTAQKPSRAVSQRTAAPPFGKVNEGDIVYMKESGGLVKGMFIVADVETFENLTAGQICDLFYKEYREQIFTPEGAVEMYDPPKKWLTAKHATLIHIAEPVKFDEPYPLPFQKRDPRAWLVLDAPLYVCEICKDNYLLEVTDDPDGKPIQFGSQHFCASCYAMECAD